MIWVNISPKTGYLIGSGGSTNQNHSKLQHNINHIISKKTKDTSFSDTEKLKPLYTVGKNEKYFQLLEESNMECFSNIKIKSTLSYFWIHIYLYTIIVNH